MEDTQSADLLTGRTPSDMVPFTHCASTMHGCLREGQPSREKIAVASSHLHTDRGVTRGDTWGNSPRHGTTRDYSKHLLDALYSRHQPPLNHRFGFSKIHIGFQHQD